MQNNHESANAAGERIIESVAADYIFSGSSALDSVCSARGIRCGSLVEVAGPPGIGTSLGMLSICRSVCEAGGTAIYLDMVRGVNWSQLEGAGLLPYYKQGSIAHPFKMFLPRSLDGLDWLLRQLLQLPSPPTLVVIDTITSAVPMELLSQPVEDIKANYAYRASARMLFRHRSLLQEKKITVVIISEIRADFSLPMVQVRPAGVRALGDMCDIRLFFEHSDEKLPASVKEEDGFYMVRVRALRNHYTAARSSVSLLMRSGCGIVAQ